MKILKLFILLCIAMLGYHLNAQESEDLYEAGDIKIGIAAVPLLDLDNGYSGILARPSVSFYVSDRLAISTSAFVMITQDVEQEMVEI